MYNNIECGCCLTINMQSIFMATQNILNVEQLLKMIAFSEFKVVKMLHHRNIPIL